VPLLLGADTLTEAVATAIPSADHEEKVSWTDRARLGRLSTLTKVKPLLGQPVPSRTTTGQGGPRG
jgi:hypothetical protein